jgi:hypothetical protein
VPEGGLPAVRLSTPLVVPLLLVELLPPDGVATRPPAPVPLLAPVAGFAPFVPPLPVVP